MIHYLVLVAAMLPLNTFMNFPVVDNEKQLTDEILKAHMKYVIDGKELNGLITKKSIEGDKTISQEETQYISNANNHMTITHSAVPPGESLPVSATLQRTMKNYRQLVNMRANKAKNYQWYMRSLIYGNQPMYIRAWPYFSNPLELDDPYYISEYSPKCYPIKVGTQSDVSILDMLLDSRVVIEKVTKDPSGSVTIQFKVVQDDKVEKKFGKIRYESGTMTLDSKRYWVIQHADFIYNKRHWKQAFKYETSSKGFPLLRSIDERTCDSTPENGLKPIITEWQSTLVIPDPLPPDSDFTLTRFELPEFDPDTVVTKFPEASDTKDGQKLPRNSYIKPDEGLFQTVAIVIAAGSSVLIIAGLIIWYRSRGQQSTNTV